MQLQHRSTSGNVISDCCLGKHGAASKVSTFVLQHVFCELFASPAWSIRKGHTGVVLWLIVNTTLECIWYTSLSIALAALLCSAATLASALTGWC